MAGLGSFIQGAFQGYKFAEDAKDQQLKRKYLQEDQQFLNEQRDRKRADWKRQDAARAAVKSIYADTKKAYDNQQGDGSNLVYTPPDAQTQAPAEPATGRSVRAATGYGDGQVDPALARAAGVQPPQQPGQGPQVATGAPDQPMPQAPQRPDITPAQASDALPAHGQAPAAQPAQPAAQPINYVGWAHQVNAPPEILAKAQRAAYAQSVLDKGVSPFSGQPMTPDERASFQRVVTNNHDGITAWAQQQGAPIPGGDATPGAPQAPQQTGTLPSRSMPAPGATPTPDAAPQGNGMPQSGAFTPDQAATAVPGAGPNPPQPAAQTGAPAGPTSRSVKAGVTAPAAPTTQADVPASNPAVVTAQTVKNETTQQLNARAAQNPPDQGGEPSVGIADKTLVPRGANGAKLSAAQRDKGVGDFMTYYAQNAVPKIEQFYLSQGDVKTAEAWRKWASATETQAHIKSWAKAVQAAAVGDENGFLNNMADAYNSINDGYKIVRNKSHFIKDKSGNITGAHVAVKNDKTGQVTEQDYSRNDIIEFGIYALSPEQMFAKLNAQVASADAAKAKEIDWRRKVALEVAKAKLKASGGGMDQKFITQRVLAEAQNIRNNNLSTNGSKPLTNDQIIQRAIQNVANTLQLTRENFGPNGQVMTEPAPYTKQPAKTGS